MLSNFIMILYNNYVLFDFHQNGSNTGPHKSGMPPEHSQTLLGHFWKRAFFVKNPKNWRKIMEMSTGRKTVFVWEIMEIKKTRIATTRIFTVRWPPHLPYGAHSWKNVFWTHSRKMKLFSEAALAADWKWGCGGRSPPPGARTKFGTWKGV